MPVSSLTRVYKYNKRYCFCDIIEDARRPRNPFPKHASERTSAGAPPRSGFDPTDSPHRGLADRRIDRSIRNGRRRGRTFDDSPRARDRQLLRATIRRQQNRPSDSESQRDGELQAVHGEHPTRTGGFRDTRTRSDDRSHIPIVPPRRRPRKRRPRNAAKAAKRRPERKYVEETK